jgi:hypothetical protein
MDIQRIRAEVQIATTSFGWVEVHPTATGEVAVKAAMQTSMGKVYAAVLQFTNYPNQMPTVMISQPTIRTGCPHRYTSGAICYLHPHMWNPGRHNVTFVLARLAKWLNKYEVWCVKGYWPGAGMAH